MAAVYAVALPGDIYTSSGSPYYILTVLVKTYAGPGKLASYWMEVVIACRGMTLSKLKMPAPMRLLLFSSKLRLCTASVVACAVMEEVTNWFATLHCVATGLTLAKSLVMKSVSLAKSTLHIAH